MGDATALEPAERRGLTLFRSLKTRCFECHGFPTLANPDFKVIGVPDLPGQKQDLGRAEAGGGPAYERAFKVPTLRNVALTAPYMHNGKFKTLEEVLAFYAKGGGKGEGLELANLDDKIRVFSLSTAEQQDLIAFLNALTDETRLPEVPERVPSGLPVVPRREAPAGGARHGRRRAPGRGRDRSARAGSAHVVGEGGRIHPGRGGRRAVPGDTIEVEPGTYRQSVLVDVDRITLRGLRATGGQRAVLDGEDALTDAVIASGHGFTIEGFALRNYTSNGITVHGATGVVFRDLVVDRTGLYGVYPVECKDVLVERVVVTGARDAAIYVGQSADIVVRKNEVHDNVTGIEIENSTNALVEDNYAHAQHGRHPRVPAPQQPLEGGPRHARRRGTASIANNHPNFGDPTAIVSKVPAGDGHLHHGRRPHRGGGERDPRQRLVRGRRGQPGHGLPSRGDLRRGPDPRGELDPRQRPGRQRAQPRARGEGDSGAGRRSPLGRERLDEHVAPAGGDALPRAPSRPLLARPLPQGVVSRHLGTGANPRVGTPLLCAAWPTTSGARPPPRGV